MFFGNSQTMSRLVSLNDRDLLGNVHREFLGSCYAHILYRSLTTFHNEICTENSPENSELLGDHYGTTILRHNTQAAIRRISNPTHTATFYTTVSYHTHTKHTYNHMHNPDTTYTSHTQIRTQDTAHSTRTYHITHTPHTHKFTRTTTHTHRERGYNSRHTLTQPHCMVLYGCVWLSAVDCLYVIVCVVVWFSVWLCVWLCVFSKNTHNHMHQHT